MKQTSFQRVTGTSSPSAASCVSASCLSWAGRPGAASTAFAAIRNAWPEIEAIHPLERDVLRIRLIDERYYHGDTCLCSFGPTREFLLAYSPVIEPASLGVLRATFGDQLLEIGDEDAAIYAANSFAFTRQGTPFLVMPEGITSSLQRAVTDRGVEILSTDVSEFHKKGGGSVKCMIGDLGELL